MMITSERKQSMIKHKKRLYGNNKDVLRFLSLALNVWDSAMLSNSPSTANAKKKEAVGWAILAAKKVAEEEVENGSSLQECLRVAAQFLLEAKEIEENV